MIRSNRNVGRVGKRDRCSYGCCSGWSPKNSRKERRSLKRAERNQWKREVI